MYTSNIRPSNDGLKIYNINALYYIENSIKMKLVTGRT